MLRAAAVGGGAYYMGKRRAEGQEQAAPQPEQATAQPDATASPAPPADSAGMSADALQRLRELDELRKQGVLTDDEFAAQKALILA